MLQISRGSDHRRYWPSPLQSAAVAVVVGLTTVAHIGGTYRGSCSSCRGARFGDGAGDFGFFKPGSTVEEGPLSRERTLSASDRLVLRYSSDLSPSGCGNCRPSCSSTRMRRLYEARAIFCRFFNPFSMIFASAMVHLMSNLSPRTDQISGLHSKYATARSSSLSWPQSSWYRLSISRSWRFLQALAVLVGKCRAAIGCQFRPAARADASTSSSAAVHTEPAFWNDPDPERDRTLPPLSDSELIGLGEGILRARWRVLGYLGMATLRL